ncbi:MAG: hypothetical protein JHD16_17005, partial [Solirubrobacteraceae bacterium]|nr:hypothetical protein [Solirubrobacteraceae bacterium]
MTATCAFHPKVETSLSCSACDKPACVDCLTPVAVGQHCDGCTKGRPAADEKGGAAFKVRSAVVGVDEYQRLRRPSLAFFIVVGLFVACCVAGWFMKPVDPEGDALAAKAVAILIVVSGAVVGL